MNELSLTELYVLYRVLISNSPKYLELDDSQRLVNNSDIDYLRLLSKVIDGLLFKVTLSPYL